MKWLVGVLALGLVGCAGEQDADAQVSVNQEPAGPSAAVEFSETSETSDQDRADRWFEQATERFARNRAVMRDQVAQNPYDQPRLKERLAAMDFQQTQDIKRLERIRDAMATGLSHREAMISVQESWHGSQEQAEYEAELYRLEMAADPDPDPLNPGYGRGTLDPGWISRRYGFEGPYQDMEPPDWVRIVGDPPFIEAAGEHARPPFCWGKPMQGGMVACFVGVLGSIRMNGQTHQAYEKDGVVLIGFDRDAPRMLRATIPQGHYNPAYDIEFLVEPRDYDTSRIDGLPKNMVSEYTAEELARIRAATARKKVGFASDIDTLGFAKGFELPIRDEFTKTTNFGAQRILNGEPKRPHYGVDLAAPKGTPIYAPADGIVSLADEDMYFEGSLVMIDHGQGLISYYLHNEDVLVEEGQRVKQGEQIATVGSRGRSTGPHLCWRLKWRGRNLDPELLTEWPKDGNGQ